MVAPLETTPVPTPISTTDPAAHEEQSTVEAAENVPAPQAVHTDAPLLTAPDPTVTSATEPAAHVVQDEAAAEEYVPALQGAQATVDCAV